MPDEKIDLMVKKNIKNILLIISDLHLFSGGGEMGIFLFDFSFYLWIQNPYYSLF